MAASSHFEHKEMDHLSYSADEQLLFDLVLNEDVEGVRSFFDLRPNFLFRTRDFVTRALLSDTIDLNRGDILKIFLDEQARIGGALFNAVRKGSKDCVQTMLPYISSKRGDIGPEDVKPGAFVSPLMLAVHLEKFDIIELFLSKGYRVLEPHDDDDEDDDDEQLNRTNVGLELSNELSFNLRVNAYRALASPLYISYFFIMNPDALHPIFHVLELNKKLKNQMYRDFEFNNDYKQISKDCQRFAVDLLEQCRTTDETNVLLDVYPEIQRVYEKDKKHVEGSHTAFKELSVLNLAIRNDMNELVAHPQSQLRLDKILYHGIYTFKREPRVWRYRSWYTGKLFWLRHTLLLPFLALFYIIAPDCRISNVLKTPTVKFYSHTSAFVLFAIALAMSSIEDHFTDYTLIPVLIDWGILLFVLGLFLQEMKDLYFQGAFRYIRQWWNIISLLMVVLFLISYSLCLTAYLSPQTSPPHLKNLAVRSSQLSLLANSFFAFAMVFSFIHLTNFLQVSDVFGPLQLSLYMLFADLIKFFVFFFVLFMAFGLSLRKLYSHYKTSQQHFVNITRPVDTDHPYSAVKSGFLNLFWSMFGLTELATFDTKDKEFSITKETGMLLFGLFQILVVIIVLNMLIAVMTRSYEEISDNSDLSWKVSRTRMWMNWVDKGNVLPPPLNLIPNSKTLAAVFSLAYRTTLGKVSKNALLPPDTSQQSPKVAVKAALEYKSRRMIIKNIVDRYLRKRREEARADEVTLRHLKEMEKRMWTHMHKHWGLVPSSPPLSEHRKQSSSLHEETAYSDHQKSVTETLV
ncbi:short transient receptor potential channel 3 isoform X2 [Nematostella vectensis]|uniref:short transient receptor potential channel 3 isoform X2 n=1 Tax=Nematostella vectensis TaxID=45351 RepID=UPI0020773C3D|nr:short transient receptor potential channel 3 isoform X2 [Nematostella vectensis]